MPVNVSIWCHVLLSLFKTQHGHDRPIMGEFTCTFVASDKCERFFFSFYSLLSCALSPPSSPPFSAPLLGGLTWLAQGAAKQNWKCLWVAWPPCASIAQAQLWPAERPDGGAQMIQQLTPTTDLQWLWDWGKPRIQSPPWQPREHCPLPFGHMSGVLKKSDLRYEMLSG